MNTSTSSNPSPLSKLLRKLPYVLLITGALFALCFCRLIVTEGASMEPTFASGDILFCVRTFSQPNAGDVVLIEAEGRLVVKRIAYVAGDEVTDTSWYRQTDTGYEPDHSGYLYWQSNIVPEGYVYVLGDNPEHSHDSRYENFGLVPIEKIWGTVAFCD